MTRAKYFSNVANALYKRECALINYYDTLNDFYHCNFLNKSYRSLMDSVMNIRSRVSAAYIKALEQSTVAYINNK